MSEPSKSAHTFNKLTAAVLGRPDTVLVEKSGAVVARLEPHRAGRAGVPEVIFAERKKPDDTIALARIFLTQAGLALISRASTEVQTRLQHELATIEINGQMQPVNCQLYPGSGFVVLTRADYPPVVTGGRVGILTAGTSDIPIAEEAQVMAASMGCEVRTIFDVGVAGLHRLLEPLQALLEWDVDVLVTAAGMDGALPSVVAGMVDVPVIGLPTSVGYGAGGKGEAALLSMLQTCAPGLAVVNIDNGVGAGSTAALIANRMAAARNVAPTPPPTEQVEPPAAMLRDEVVVLETNLDDMTAEAQGYLMEQLLAAGALDVYFTPLQMKKNRPGTLLGVIAQPQDEARLAELILTESSSFGLRVSRHERYITDRTLETVDTPLGQAQVKVKQMHGQPVEAVPEYASVTALAQHHNLPWRKVYEIVQQAAHQFQSIEPGRQRQ